MKSKISNFILSMIFSLLCINSLTAQIIIASCPSCTNNCTEDAQTLNMRVVQGAGAGAHIFKLCRKATAHNEIKFKTNGDFNISTSQHIWLDFGDGSPEIEIFPSSIYSHTYPISTTDADFFLKATIKEANFPDAPMATPKLVIKASYTNNAAGYTPPDEIWNIAGSHAYLKFADAHPGKLLRPVIFVDGIDFDLTEYTVNGQTVRHGSTGWDVFILGNDHSTPNPDNTLPSEFKNYPLAFQTLNENEYDIVFLDFKDGSDFIQNNGEVLISLIEAVNQRKAQDAINSGQNACENVVIGASMGGQIAKWAISTMEERNKDHQCHTYVSFDSPHKGAHIPLSLQALVYMLKESGEPEVWDKLNTPATHQLLQETLIGAYLDEKIELEMLEMNMCSSNIDLPINFGTYTNAGQTRQNFVNEMAQLGYPQSTRNLAISCGTTNGTGIGYTMNQSLLEATIRQVGGSTRAFYTECVNMGGKTLGGQTLIGPVCTKHLIIRDNSFFMGAIPLQFVWQLNPFVNPPGKYLVLNGRVLESFSNFDGAPGCLRGDLMTFKQELLGLHTSMEVPIPNAAAYHTFMPTLSLLDVNWEMDDDHLYKDIDINQEISNGNIPFAAAYAPNENLRHVELTEEMINWLLPQIQIGQNELENESLNLSNGQTFNYGKRKNRVPNTTINTGGILAVNLAGNINYQTPQDPLSDKPHFKVYIGSGCSTGKIVKVRSGGKLQIGDPNNANKSGSFFATAGSTVHVETNGILRISNGSQLVIQVGASLILDPGAKIQLDDPEAKIRIEGTIQINGDIVFSGLGYFEFGNFHTLLFGSGYTTVRLTGSGKTNRFIQLDHSATLAIPNFFTLQLSNGAVTGGRGITLGASTNATFENVRFYTAEIAISALTGMTDLVIRNCDFDNLLQPIDVRFTGGNILLGIRTEIIGCVFTNYETACSFALRPFVNSLDSRWDGNNRSTYGLRLVDNFVTRLNNCLIENHSGDWNTGYSNPLLDGGDAGVFLDGGWVFWMQGGAIRNCTYGILNREFYWATGNPTNIILSNNATIETTIAGIVQKGNASVGMISMNCAKILNSRTCIFGEDIRLNIDVPAQFPSSGASPNRFERTFDGANASRFIRNCYVATTTPGSVLARRNIWRTTAGNDPSPNLACRLVADVSGNTCSTASVSNVPLVFLPSFSGSMVSNCETEVLCDDPENCDDDCIMIIHPDGGETTGETVKQAFLRGMDELANEQFETAKATFADIAREGEGEGSFGNPPPPNWNLICKTLTDAAYSLSNSSGERNLKPGQSKNTKPDLDASGIAIYPNPTANFATIILPKKLSHISVSDVHGKTVFETAAAESLDISTANWQDGVYFITIEPTDKSKRVVQKKLLVQRL